MPMHRRKTKQPDAPDAPDAPEAPEQPERPQRVAAPISPTRRRHLGVPSDEERAAREAIITNRREQVALRREARGGLTERQAAMRQSQKLTREQALAQDREAAEQDRLDVYRRNAPGLAQTAQQSAQRATQLRGAMQPGSDQLRQQALQRGMDQASMTPSFLTGPDGQYVTGPSRSHPLIGNRIAESADVLTRMGIGGPDQAMAQRLAGINADMMNPALEAEAQRMDENARRLSGLAQLSQPQAQLPPAMPTPQPTLTPEPSPARRAQIEQQIGHLDQASGRGMTGTQFQDYQMLQALAARQAGGASSSGPAAAAAKSKIPIPQGMIAPEPGAVIGPEDDALLDFWERYAMVAYGPEKWATVTPEDRADLAAYYAQSFGGWSF